MDPLDQPAQLKAFAYLNAEKARLYRSIMSAFTDAKERFALHLRSADLLAAVVGTTHAEDVVPVGEPEIEAALGQLCDWGNLEAHPDLAEVSTVEDFYRPRFLYQLTTEGEAAERAVRHYFDALVQPGELQAAALADILTLLGELQQLAKEPEPDAGKVHRALRSLRERFDELTARAQAFISSLQRTIDLHSFAEAKFLTYKRTLVEYLERFIGELVIATAAIGEAIQSLERADGALERILAIAASRELGDAIAATEDDQRRALESWRARWAGLRGWFLGTRERPSQSEVLRGRARSAIPALLSAIAGIHDRRATRTDRAADLKVLARWFLETDSDEDAHRLWRAAFGLTPARHLSIDEETLAQREAHPVPPTASWLDAPPIRIAPRLRTTGRYTRRGRTNNVIDRSEAKRALLRLAELEAQQLDRARTRLALGRSMRLSEFGMLEGDEFQLLLDLLGEALGARTSESEVIEATSSDGSLRIILSPLPLGERRREAVIRTSTGDLRGPDQLVTISDAFADTASDERVESTAAETPTLHELDV